MVLQAKSAVSNSLWDAKVDTFKRWDWSEDEVFIAFRNQPNVCTQWKNSLQFGEKGCSEGFGCPASSLQWFDKEEF